MYQWESGFMVIKNTELVKRGKGRRKRKENTDEGVERDSGEKGMRSEGIRITGVDEFMRSKKNR